jgi:hypothetical protein
MSMYEFIQQISKSLKLKEIFGHLNNPRKNVVNCKVLDHVQSYNYGIYHINIQGHLKIWKTLISKSENLKTDI